ncbi:hypothetical protein [Krasilnikovia sp. MM14-A1004]|uniref:hypothetical protein n=1 Tax=Krasilnikovia sp. MM14-A1004 TaxID=3373541 RepID=UPI00399C77F5
MINVRRTAVAALAAATAVIGAPSAAVAAPIPMPSNCPSGYLCVWDPHVIAPGPGGNPTYKIKVSDYPFCHSWPGGDDALKVANHSGNTIHVYTGNNCNGTKGTIYPQTANDNMGYWATHIVTFSTKWD